MNLINPAFAWADGTEIGLGIRNQWANVVGAPTTQSVFFGHDFGRNVGLGVSVINDKKFIDNQTSIAIDFSYKLNLSERTQLFLGLKGTVNSYDANLDDLKTLNTVIDPSLNAIDGGFNPNLGVGVLLKGRDYFLSFSIPKILISDRLEDTNGTIGLGSDRIHWF